MRAIKSSRLLMFFAVVFLLAVFTGSLWRITLDAPQFPEGLELNIWVDGFTGPADSDANIIQNINILNHYIGMQEIVPESIPELVYFPYVIYVVSALGLIALLANKWKGYLAWAMVLAILGLLGFYDFYLWMYDYGHNLDPAAPIKVPGMTYMPPMLGEKDLLNFYVKSYPRSGAWCLGLAVIFSAFAAWTGYKRTTK